MSEPSLSSLSTELQNSASALIDTLSSLELVTLINCEDAQVIGCIKSVLPEIGQAIDEIVPRLRRGGRVIYFGAGTSGRLGILDASECRPTFNSDQFVGIMAGGDEAIRKAKEGVEDQEEAGERDLVLYNLNPDNDVAIGLAASGRTPYVLGGLRYARSIGCLTVGVACTYPSAMSQADIVDIMISPISGPEVVTGSTRLKAGTTTKLVLNMLSTGTMIKLGKTFGNLMVDLRLSNAKLQARGRGIIRAVNKDGIYLPPLSILDSRPSDDTLDLLISQCDNSVKLAIVVGRTGWSVTKARNELDLHQGVLAHVLEAFATIGETPATSSPEIFNICVDGGGTQTRVILSTLEGEVVARGTSGPSNVSAIGVHASLMSLRSAINAALDALSPPIPFKLARFNKAWVAHAGIDPRTRPVIYNEYANKVQQLLNLQLGNNLKVTSDAQLLTAALLTKPQKQGVILVAGTGSVSMMFLPKKDSTSGDLEMVRRAGGYGYLLGDEGSAYAIGRDAIRHALDPLTSYLTDALLKHFQIQDSAELIPHVYGDPNSSKSTIASASRVVLDLFEKGDPSATAIVETAVGHLADLVVQVVLEDRPSKELAICVTGGLATSEAFRQALTREMNGRGDDGMWNLYWVDDPALVACQGLSLKGRFSS